MREFSDSTWRKVPDLKTWDTLRTTHNRSDLTKKLGKAVTDAAVVKYSTLPWNRCYTCGKVFPPSLMALTKTCVDCHAAKETAKYESGRWTKPSGAIKLESTMAIWATKPIAQCAKWIEELDD